MCLKYGMTRNLYDPESCSWYRLNWSIDRALQPMFYEFWSQQPPNLYVLEPQRVFTDQWLDYLYSQWAVEFFNVLVWTRAAEQGELTAHVDKIYSEDSTVPIISAVNWCLGPDLRPMQWWRVPPVIDRPYQDSGYSLETTDQGVLTRSTCVMENQRKITHQQWYCSQLALRDQCIIGSQPTLLRVDQPHSIALGDTARFSISARLLPLNRSWSQTVRDLYHAITPDY